MKFKIGDEVTVRNVGDGSNGYSWQDDGVPDDIDGEAGTVLKSDALGMYEVCIEEHGTWWFYENELEGVEKLDLERMNLSDIHPAALEMDRFSMDDRFTVSYRPRNIEFDVPGYSDRIRKHLADQMGKFIYDNPEKFPVEITVLGDYRLVFDYVSKQEYKRLMQK